MRKFFLLFALAAINLFAANIPSYIIIVAPNRQNILAIKNHNIPLLHQSENSLILIADESSLNYLGENNVTFQNVGQFLESEQYFLITRKHHYDAISYSDLTGLLFANEEFAIVQTASTEEIIKKGLIASKLKIINRLIEPNPLIIFRNSSVASDSLLSKTIKEVSPDSVRNWIQSLQNFNTRFMLAINRKVAANWIKNQFLRFGYADAHLDSFYVFNSWQYNVIATLTATEKTDKVFVVGGHHDSITSNNPYITAPGADDNASGTAAVLEIARVLAKTNFQAEANIIFSTFAGEEYGLFGSQYFANLAKQNGMKIELMINHDMIATSSNIPTSSSVTINHYTGSEKFTELALNTIKKFTPLNSISGDLNASYSDSYSFWINGFKTIYFEETQFSSVYHTDNDKILYCNIPYCAEVIKASCATLINAMILPENINNLNISDVNSGTSVQLSWDHNTENDFAYHKIYIGLSSGNYYKSFSTTDNQFTINNLLAGQKYFIGVSTIDKQGNESFINEKPFTPINFTFDKGVLIVDETYDGNGNIGRPNDIAVDNFYADLLKNFNVSTYDVVEMNGISAINLAAYSTIIWHGDDYVNLSIPFSIQDEIKRYLHAGGNFIYSGFTPSKAFVGNYKYPSIYLTGDFLNDVLKIGRVEKHTGSKFCGAISTSFDFPYIQLDSAKIPMDYNNHISNIEAIYPTLQSNAIFLFDTKFDTSTVMGSMYKKPVGIEYLGNDYKLLILSFPLYFMEEKSANILLQKILNEHFDETTIVNENISTVPNSINLAQNYPNPFNPITTIEYSIPSNFESAKVELKVYDALGREISILVDEEKSTGLHKIIFDGSKLASGLYYYRLKIGETTQIKKMILLK